MGASETGDRPAGQLAGGRAWPAAAALCLIQFVDVLCVTVVAAALPTMLADVGARPTDSTLVATGYPMFFGGLLMFGARLGDRIGHRRCILVSLLVFAAGSVLAAVAGSALTLVAARCVQGAAAAGAVPSALRLLTSVVGSERGRARALAAWSAAGAAAGACGLVVGGLVTAAGSWRAIFWALLAVAVAQAASVLALLPPDPRDRNRPALNLPGSALLTAAIMAAVVGATLLGEPGHRAAGSGLLGAAVLGAVGFVFIDRRSSAPLLPRDVIARAPVRRGSAGAFVNTATTSSVAILATLYLQNTLGWTPVQAAAALLPLSVLVIAGSAAAARLIVRHRDESVAAAGLGLIGAGVAALLLGPDVPVLVATGLGLAGVGLGLASVATTSMATDVPEPVRATASGLVNTSAQLGTALGTAAVLLVAAATTGVPDRDSPAPLIAWAVAAGAAAVAAAAFARTRSRTPAKPASPSRSGGPAGRAPR